MRTIHLLVLTMMTCCLHFANAGDWNLAKDKNGIMVYTREAEGSDIKEFKAITTLDANLEDIIVVLQDYENYPKWYDHVKTSYLIEKKENEANIYHLEMGMPFPFSNRDVVCKMVIDDSKDWVEVWITNEIGIKPPDDGIVRMPVASGSWKLKQISSNKVEVHHQFKGDPAGNIPAGIVNMFLVAGPLNTMTQLQEYISSR
ncbi:MAG: hypothetical protein JXR07_07535 [Reichenbachiella sp.]